jgi:hypothetical protein
MTDTAELPTVCPGCNAVMRRGRVSLIEHATSFATCASSVLALPDALHMFDEDLQSKQQTNQNSSMN